MLNIYKVPGYDLRKAARTKQATLFVFFLAFSIHTAVLLLYNFFIEQNEVINYFRAEFNFSIIVLQVLSAMYMIARKKLQLVFIFLFKTLLITIVGIPLGKIITIEALLYTVLAMELMVHFSFIIFLLFSIVSSLLLFFFQKTFTVWFFTEVHPPDGESLFFFFVFSGLLIILLSLLKIRTDRLAFLEGRNKQLSTTVSNLVQANKGFQEYALLAKEKAESEERKRISREIHDTVGYAFTNLIVMMESATDFSKVDPLKTNQLLEGARQQAKKGFEEMRRSLRLLRTVGDNRLRGISALQELINTFRNSTGIEIAIEYGNLPWTVGEELDEIIYHIIQEGLINAFRHGHASVIRILLWVADGHIKLSITDNGVGASFIQEGIGIAGMKENLLPIGGRIRIDNVTSGFQLSAEIPLLKKKGSNGNGRN